MRIKEAGTKTVLLPILLPMTILSWLKFLGERYKTRQEAVVDGTFCLFCSIGVRRFELRTVLFSHGLESAQMAFQAGSYF